MRQPFEVTEWPRKALYIIPGMLFAFTFAGGGVQALGAALSFAFAALLDPVLILVGLLIGSRARTGGVAAMSVIATTVVVQVFISLTEPELAVPWQELRLLGIGQMAALGIWATIFASIRNWRVKRRLRRMSGGVAETFS